MNKRKIHIRLTEAERDEMLRLWKHEQKGMAELAKRFDINVYTANRIVTQMDEKSLKEVKERRRLVDEQLENIMRIKSNTGADSTEEELKKAREKELECVNRIKKIDPEYFVTIKADTE